MGSQDYPCGEFGDCSFSHFGSIMRTNTHRQTQMNALLFLFVGLFVCLLTRLLKRLWTNVREIVKSGSGLFT